VVVGNWKSLEDFSRSPDQNQAIRRQLGIPESAMVVVCISQLFVDRKLEELLEVVDLAPNVYFDHRRKRRTGKQSQNLRS